MTRNEYLFIERARYFSNLEYIILYCDLVKKVIQHCNISKESKAYSITVRKKKSYGFSFNLNRRLISSIWHDQGKEVISFVFNEEDIEKHSFHEAFYKREEGLFADHRSALLYFDLEKLLLNDNKELINDFVKSAKDGFNRNHKSSVHYHNMPEVYDLIIDDQKRQEIFHYVESEEEPFKMLLKRVLKKDRIQEMIELPTFYYRKAQEIFEEFLSFEIADQEMDAIIDEYDQYSDGNYLKYVESLPNGDKKAFADIIGRLIAHLDFNAAGKNEWNEIKDKRVIAKSLVRQKIWIKSLIDFKNSEKDPQVVQSHSIRCALELLLDPNRGIPMLSKGHRKKICQFLSFQPYDEVHPESFVDQLKTYFKSYNIQLNNKDNLTTIISACLYDEEIEDIWNDRNEPKTKFDALSKTKQKKYRALLERYKEKVQQGGYLADEVYKFEAIQHFQNTFDIEAENFGDNLIESLKKDTNLRYRNSQNFIKGLATHFPEDARTLFRILVDIGDELKEGELSKLVKIFSDQASTYEEKVKKAMGKEKISHTQDERSLSTYLTFLYPERFCFYMNGVYQPVAEYVGVDTKKAGKKYEHFLFLLEPLQDLILQDEELIAMVRKELSPESFDGDITAAISQDIVYRLIKYGEINWSIEEMKEKFEEYLDRVIPKSKRNYMSAIPTIDRIAVANNLIKKSVYELQNSDSLEKFLSQIDSVDEYQKENKGGNGMYQAALRKYKDFLNEYNNEEFPEMNNEVTNPQDLNVILYGPPGTGKTYVSKSKAVEIIDGFTSEERDNINARYNELVENGNILFVTFHQSTGYEDFIEGIKPELDNEEEDQIGYHIEDGVFKRMCIKASYEYIKSSKSSKAVERTLNFTELFDGLVAMAQDALEKDDAISIKQKSGREIDIIEITSRGNFKLMHKDGKVQYTVSKDRLEKLYNEIDDFDTIPNIYHYFRSIIGGSNASAYWAVLNQIYELEKSDRPKPELSKVTYEDKKKAFERLNWDDVNINVDVPRYVIIIDEINRGNVAMILGELITLLEEDKRGGKDEFLNAILPYSKKKFSVPPNIYVIGTMNTADRSVEALDSALRRRFTFIEVTPDPEVVKQPDNLDVNLKSLLNAINQRIEILLDKDHKIGHSYFMKIHESQDPEVALKKVFANKVIPLLEEYFYGDLSKVGLILGNSFVGARNELDDRIWARGDDFEKPDPPESAKFYLIEEEEWTSESFKSIYEK